MLDSLIRNFHLRRFMRRKSFVHAAAFLEKNRHSNQHLPYLYACLGMYQSVLSSNPCNHILDQAAYIAALAASGSRDQAKISTQGWLKQRPSPTLRIWLAQKLAAYYPPLALQVLQTLSHPPTLLYSALLTATGHTLHARQILSTDNRKTRDAEVYLLRENISANSTPQSQCAAINRYLAHFGLDPVALQNPAQALSAANIESLCTAKIEHQALVSILVTTHNNADRLPECIRSLLRQSYQNIEILIIDDACTDHTEKVMQTLKQTDSRIRIIRLPENVGTFAAKNIAMQYARGEFVICHDSDDWAHPRKIEYQVLPLISRPNLVFSISRWVRITDSGLFYARQIFPFTRLNLSSLMFRKNQVIHTCGLWDMVRTGADSEFFERLKLSFAPESFVYIKKPLTLGAHRENSLMTAPDTGYDQYNASPIRLAYWEAWRRWHLDCIRQDYTPVMPKNIAQHPFPIPQELAVGISGYTHAATNHHFCP